MRAWQRIRRDDNYPKSIVDADALAIIAAMTTPSSTYQTAINNFVKAAKENGYWTKIGSMAMFAGGSETNALVDWKLKGNWVKTSTPTFTANQGYTGNGSSAKINSPTPNNDWAPYVRDNCCASYYVRTYGNGEYGSTEVTLSVMHRNAQGKIQSDGTNTSLTSNTSAGLKSFVRTSATAVEGFHDATSLGTGTPADWPLSTDTLAVFRNQPTNGWSTDQISCVVLGSAFTGAQCGLLKADIDNFLASVA